MSDIDENGLGKFERILKQRPEHVEWNYRAGVLVGFVNESPPNGHWKVGGETVFSGQPRCRCPYPYWDPYGNPEHFKRFVELLERR